MPLRTASHQARTLPGQSGAPGEVLTVNVCYPVPRPLSTDSKARIDPLEEERLTRLMEVSEISGLRVIMLGGTGAVGNHAARTLARMSRVDRLTLLGRREAPGLVGPDVSARVVQSSVDVLDPSTHDQHIPGHQVALCCLGVGEPSKISREEFVKVDKDAVLNFARACKRSGVLHFELLASVGVDARSRSFYLRTKGELEQGLRDLHFDRLSLFHPSMILTPENRYGVSQAITLSVWPLLTPMLAGSLRKLRGIPVKKLGAAMALNVVTDRKGEETLEWDEIMALTADVD